MYAVAANVQLSAQHNTNTYLNRKVLMINKSHGKKAAHCENYMYEAQRKQQKQKQKLQL
jgi:hypothetical protein